MPTRLRLRSGAPIGTLPVDAERLGPDSLAGRARREIEGMPILVGNRSERLGDLFEVGGDGTDSIEVEGDLSRFARLGAGMTRGSLTIRGSAGARAGSGMRGGVLRIEGSAGDYAGEAMTGGLLRIGGAAGDHLGAPWPGARHGMNRGAILVGGSAGEMAGFRMRRGTIVVCGDAGAAAGCGMLAGSIFVLGRLGAGAGALMRRGTLVALGPHQVLPVFLDAGSGRFPFLNLYYERIEAAGLRLPEGVRAGRYRRYVGDISDLGHGEILALEENA